MIRLAGALLIEQADEWLVGRRYLSEASMGKVLACGQDSPNKEIEEGGVVSIAA